MVLSYRRLIYATVGMHLCQSVIGALQMNNIIHNYIHNHRYNNWHFLQFLSR